MGDKTMFEKDSRIAENPKHLQRNVFILYSRRTLTIELASNKKIDTEITAFYQEIQRDALLQNLELSKLMKFFTGINTYGWEY